MMKLFLKNEKGMTLVELVVTLLLMSIALGSIGAIIPMVQKHYARAEGISYKQGTVTDVETRLQNALGRGAYIFIKDTPDGDYNLGFNEEGQCVEVTKGTGGEGTEVKVILDQISKIDLEVFGTKEKEENEEENEEEKEEITKGKSPETHTIEYKLWPKDTTMSKLIGGTVMNNIVVGSNYKEENFKKEDLSSDTPNKYLVIDFGKWRDPVPRTLYERMLQTYKDFWKISQDVDPKNRNKAFMKAGFIQSNGTPGFYANNDIFRNRLYNEWYDKNDLPIFDPGNYVYDSDRRTVPVAASSALYVNPYIVFIGGDQWEPSNEEPRIFLFAGEKRTCDYSEAKNWNTQFIFLAEKIDKESGEVFGNWYYNKIDRAKSYIPPNVTFQKLKTTILETEKHKWEKLFLKMDQDTK